MAVDDNGNALPYSGGQWGTAEAINTGPTSPGQYRLDDISCSSTTFCAASTIGGDVLTWDGQSWSRASGATTFGNVADGAMSCLSTSFCMSLASGRAVAFDGVSWSTSTQVEEPNGGHTSDLSCATTSFCVGVDTAGNAVMYDGVHWTQAAGAAPLGDARVSCPTTTYCVAVAGEQAAIYTGSSWSAAAGVAGATVNLSSISCPIAGTCVAIDSAGNAFTLATGSWTKTSAVDTSGRFAAVSCSSVAFCAAVDGYGGATTRTADGWTGVTTFDQNTGGLTGVSCPTAQFCAAVDYSGNALTFSGGTWSAPQSIDPHVDFGAVSCAAATFCVATGSIQGVNSVKGVLYVFNGANWQLVPNVTTIGSVSCPTTTFCRGVGSAGELIAYNAATWTVAPSGLNNFSGPLACTSPTFCTNGYYFWNGTTWTFKGGPVGSAGEVSCASPAFCAMPGNFHMHLWDGTAWHDSTAVENLSATDSNSCPSATLCALTNRSSGTIRPFENGAVASAIVVEPNPANFTGFQDISCPSIAVCAAVDYEHAARWNTGLATAPVITSQPVSRAVVYRQTTTFHAAATGTPTPSVQWQRSTDGGNTWTNIVGATQTTISVVAKVTARYRAVFRNIAGNATSAAATLTVWRAPAVTLQPQSQSAQANHYVTFHAGASGTPTPTVRWQVSSDGGKHWTSVIGGTHLSMTVHATRSRSGFEYRAHFTNRVGSINTRGATLTVTS